MDIFELAMFFLLLILNNLIFIFLIALYFLKFKKDILRQEQDLKRTVSALKRQLEISSWRLEELCEIEDKLKSDLESFKKTNRAISREILENLQLKRKIVLAKANNLRVVSAEKINSELKKELAYLYASGWTQRQLAKKYNISQSSVSKIINEKKDEGVF